MRTFLSILLALLCVALFVLTATNPQMSDFKTFVGAHSQEVVEKHTGGSALGRALSKTSGSIVVAYVDQFGERENYVVCSVYTLDRKREQTEQTDWRFLGIAGRFIPLDEPKEKTRARR